ncbi:MAG: aspartate carbamoyltransferase catalytic subunit [Acidimicrobiia bacterium]|nr:aspartate carbamoyltransferase catalytic subunit [Acidimicrobiia bacterium]
MKTFTSIRGLGREELSMLIDSAMEGPRRSDELSGSMVGLMFFENSTRTRVSFQLAAHRLGADVITFDPEASSTAKGETLRDTVATVSAIGCDVFVVRHKDEGVPDLVHEWTGKPVVNAGDGAREHPTQALVDAVTLTSHFGSVDGLRIGVVGDVAHSRVVGSLIHALPTLGASLGLIGPEELLPTPKPHGVTTSSDLDAALPGLDVVYLLRVQRERGARTSSSYESRFQMTTERAASMADGAVIMHPGPINRGVELVDEVADGPRSLILDQVAWGVPVRMAVLRALSGGTR